MPYFTLPGSNIQSLVDRFVCFEFLQLIYSFLKLFLLFISCSRQQRFCPLNGLISLFYKSVAILSYLADLFILFSNGYRINRIYPSYYR